MIGGRREGGLTALVLAATMVAGGCAALDPSAAAGRDRALDRALVPTSSTVAPAEAATVAPSEGPVAEVAPPPSTTTAPEPPPPTAAPRPRLVVPQAWVPYATAGPVVLHHPSDHTEAVGFHQSGHDGAQGQLAVASAVRWFTMEDRGRDTHPHGAADLVVEPDRPLRVPVTGRVLRGGQYVLYCDHVDEFVVIEPDARPDWEVKVLHVEGLAIRVGEHVEAGVTPLAARARVLPFPSQVEESTGEPPWPHVHIEVVDPSVPDRPSGPGCP